MCGASLFFVPWLTPLFLGRGEIVAESELAKTCTPLLLLVPFQLGTVSGLYYLQALKRSGLFTSIQTVKLLFEVGLNVYLMGAKELGVVGFLMSMLAGEIVTSTREHEDIVNAIQSGQPEKAEAAVHRNWHNAAERLSQVIERVGERGRW